MTVDLGTANEASGCPDKLAVESIGMNRPERHPAEKSKQSRITTVGIYQTLLEMLTVMQTGEVELPPGYQRVRWKNVSCLILAFFRQTFSVTIRLLTSLRGMVNAFMTTMWSTSQGQSKL